MFDWTWIPGAAAGSAGVWHSLWLRRYVDDQVKVRAAELQRQVMDQYMHGLQLWPRPWLGNRPLTQVEEITREPLGFPGMPIPPDEQLEQMKADAQALLDSYKPRKPHE
jgi:hypothetical protein